MYYNFLQGWTVSFCLLSASSVRLTIFWTFAKFSIVQISFCSIVLPPIDIDFRVKSALLTFDKNLGQCRGRRSINNVYTNKKLEKHYENSPFTFEKQSSFEI